MKVPSTISDKEMKKLQDRASKVAPPMFSTEAIAKRKMFSKQKYKSEQS